MRIKLIVAYDGTAYCGWQVQPNGLTIEEVLNEALTKLFNIPIKVIGASRTDSGVHSMGNVAIFDVDTKMEPTRISFALNQMLPGDIVVVDSKRVEDNWHPHLVNSIKTYEYHILNRTFPDPIKRSTTYHYHHDLDVDKMNEASKYLVGEHDFTSFASVKSQVNSFVRTLYEVSVKRVGDEIIIKCVGNGFLYNMVRIIAGTLIQVGACKIEPKEIDTILKNKDREAAGPTAPPHGLTMVGIEYLD